MQIGREHSLPCVIKYWGRDKMAVISDIFKILNLKLNFTETCSLESDWQDGNIGSDNALVPIRRQAIIWSIYSSLDLNELTVLNGRIRGETETSCYKKMLVTYVWQRWREDIILSFVRVDLQTLYEINVEYLWTKIYFLALTWSLITQRTTWCWWNYISNSKMA